MMKSLALACALVMAGSGCAVGAIDGEQQEAERDLVAESQAALSGSSSSSVPKGATQLYARATFDVNLGVTMVDVATSPIPTLGNVPSLDPHAPPRNQDKFLVLMVYVDRAGRRDLLRVLGRAQIGPGGGCIHFNIVAAEGDRLFIGGVVRLNGDKPTVGIVPAPITVGRGDWQNDPIVQIDPNVK